MTTGRWQRLLAPACALAAGGAVAFLALGSARASTAAVAYQRELAARQASATTAAAELLGALQLPAGSVPSATEPAGDGGYLARAVFARGTAAPNAVEERGWWIVPGTPAQALAYVHEHLPSGARWWNGRYPPQPVPAQESAVLRSPDTGGVLGERVLTLKVAQLSGSHTGLRADAEVLWLVPAAQIPRGARVLRVAAALVGPFHRILRTVSLRSTAHIGAITRLLNAGRLARPSFLRVHCPRRRGSVLLSFYRRAGAMPLATATVAVGRCGGLTVSVPGRLPVRRETPPQLLRQLEPVLGLAFP